MDSHTTAQCKHRVRRQLAACRDALDAADKQRQSAAVISYAAALVRGQPADRTAVATYYPQPTEPGGSVLVDALRGEARTLYLPVTRPGGELRWAPYLGPAHVHTARWGITEPVGPNFGTSVLTECSVVFVPALGVTPAGVRLGRGGGFYDRTLAGLAELAPSSRPIVAVLLFDGEITDSITPEPHDMPVDLAVTPRGITRFA